MTERRSSAVSSAAAAPDVDEDAARPESPFPRRPGAFELLSIVFAGGTTAVAMAVFTLSVLAPYFITYPEPRDFIGYVAFGGGTAVILAMAAAAYLRAQRQEDRNEGRWIGLTLPFFVVVGVVLGYQFTRSVAANTDHREYVAAKVCEASVVARTFNDGACVARALVCHDKLLADFHILPRMRSELEACTIRAGFRAIVDDAFVKQAGVHGRAAAARRDVGTRR